jgi:hypothetical protein
MWRICICSVFVAAALGFVGGLIAAPCDSGCADSETGNRFAISTSADGTGCTVYIEGSWCKDCSSPNTCVVAGVNDECVQAGNPVVDSYHCDNCEAACTRTGGLVGAQTYYLAEGPVGDVNCESVGNNFYEKSCLPHGT